MSFYEVLSKYYEVLFPSNPTQMDFINNTIKKDNSSILDIAAGSGNQAIELARLHHNVTAIDLDENMVKKIQQKKQEGFHNLTAKQMDMRAIDQLPPGSFDVIICIGNSIVHLDSLAEMKSFLDKVYQNLAENGTFIVQVVNYDKILTQNITKLPVIERKGEDLDITFIRSYEKKNNKILFTGELLVEQNGTKEVFNNTVELYPLTSKQLTEALQQANFKNIQLFGDFKGSEYSEYASALIAVSEK